MDTTWLQQRTTPERAERDNLVADERLGPEPVAFGFQHEEWQAFKARLASGDELWEFTSPPDYWQHLAGSAGLCIVRDGEIVASIVTARN